MEFLVLNLVDTKLGLWLRGVHKRGGVDFNKVFSIVVKSSSIRVLLAITTSYKSEIGLNRC